MPYTDTVHITESDASELNKVMDEKLDIPLSMEPDASTASVVMKHSMKVNVYGSSALIELPERRW